MRASDAKWVVAGLAAVLLGASAAVAQSQRAPGNNAAAAAAAQQAAAAQAELAGAKQQLADAQKELAAVKAERDGLVAKATAAAADRQKEASRADSVAREVETVRESLAGVQRQLQEKTAALRAAEAHSAELDGNLSKLNSTYGLCLNTNLELAGLALEAVDRYEKVESLSRREPFTKLAKIRAQNIADETRTAISRLAIKPSASSDR
jgi:DNA repair exonuclease SbcCD ATPase subunit